MKKVVLNAKQEVRYSKAVEMSDKDWATYCKIIGSGISSSKMDEQAAILFEKYGFPDFREPSGFDDLEDVEAIEV